MEPEVKIEPNFIHHSKSASNAVLNANAVDQDTRETRLRVAEGIRDIRTCMMTTVTPEGRLESTPMTTLEIDENDNIWFLVGLDSDSSEAIDREENVNLTYASPKDFKFISVTGSASLVLDRTKAARLWNPNYQTWFPKGLDDPNLALLQVKIITAEYWENAHSRPLRVFGLVRALFTGEPFDVGIDHEKLKLN
jgi:general stress protein 26